MKLQLKSYHVVVPMFVPEHVGGLLLPLPESVLGNGRGEPERYYPLGDVAEVHAADGTTTSAAAGARPRESRLRGEGFPESVARTRRQHLQWKRGDRVIFGKFQRRSTGQTCMVIRAKNSGGVCV